MITTCTRCGCTTPAGWERCGYCGAQRLLDHEGTIIGFAPFAGFWRRAAAGLLDALLVVGPWALVLWLVPEAQRLDLAVIAVLYVLCYPLVVTAWSGDTWGKRALRCHVVEEDGRPLSRGRASAREGVGKIVELLLIVPIGVGGLVSAAFDVRKRTLHDRMAGTVCVRGRATVKPQRL